MTTYEKFKIVSLALWLVVMMLMIYKAENMMRQVSEILALAERVAVAVERVADINPQALTNIGDSAQQAVESVSDGIGDGGASAIGKIGDALIEYQQRKREK